MISLLLIFHSLEDGCEENDKLKSLFESLHRSDRYDLSITSIVLYVKMVFGEKRKRDILSTIYQLEYSINGGCWIKTEESFKRNIGNNYLCQDILDSQSPGIKDKLPQNIKEHLHRTFNYTWIKMLIVFSKIIFYYLDLSNRSRTSS